MLLRERLRQSKALCALLLIVFLLMLLLNALTPMAVDDYSYSFSWADNTRIRSLAQIPASMAVHRNLTNGRVFAHSLVQLFLMLPKAVFNGVNAANAVALMLLTARFLPTRDRMAQLLPLLCGALLVWNFTPSFGENFLWLDGSINYSWALSLLLLFLWPYAAAYLGRPVKRGVGWDLLRIPLAFLAGAYSENASLVFLFLALCLYLLQWRKSRRAELFPLLWLAAAVLGFVFLMRAPATADRGAALNLSVLANQLRAVISMTRETQFWLYLIYAFLLALAWSGGADKRALVVSLLLVLGGLASLASLVFAVYVVPRHFCCSSFLTVLACVLLLGEMREKGQFIGARLLLAAMSVLFVFQFTLGALDITVCWHKAREREREIQAALAAGETELTVDNCLPFTRYAFDFILDPDDSEIWPNNVVRTYYGLDKIYGRTPGEGGE